MQYWQYLDLQGWEYVRNLILARLVPALGQDIFWNNIETEVAQALVPELFELLTVNGYTITKASIIRATRRFGAIHTDCTDVIARINIPLMNTEGSSTVFYKCSAPPILGRSKSSTFLLSNPSTCKEETRVQLLRPTILRISEPHAVFTQRTPRLSLTLRVHPDPGLLLTA